MSLIIPFGPQHPALHEPEHFRFKVEGEVVVDVDVKIGYVHRGIEKLMTTKTYVQDIYIAERVCGICNVAHTTCYVQAVEEAAGVEVPPRAKFLRVLINELARIHSHLLIIGVAAEEIGFETFFMYTWRDRELVMKLIEHLTGNRVMSAFNTIGGVRRDLTPEVADKIKKALPRLRETAIKYKKVMEEDPLFRDRMVNVGVISKRDAIIYGATGPVERASGIDSDVRKDDPYAAYDEVPFNVITYNEGDSWARMMVRIDEVLESINMIEYVLEHIPGGEIRVPVKRRVPPNEAIARVEAPRGELLYHLISDGSDKPYRLKIKTPTFSNIYPIARAIIGETIADIPAILVSMDPCFCCMDRLEFIDVRTGEKWTMSARDIVRKYWR